jgi:predicted dehydrogenase
MFEQAVSDDFPLLVGYQHAFNPITELVLNQIKTHGQPETISIKFHEYLRDMNKFRDMSHHHLASADGGGVILALSHEIDFVLQAIDSEMSKLKFHLHSSGEFPNVIDEATINCFMGNQSNTLTEVNISLRYSKVPRERNGRVTWENSLLDWNFLTGEISLTSREFPEFTEVHSISGDKLIANQLIFLLDKSYFDNDLERRLRRAVEIVRLNELAMSHSLK